MNAVWRILALLLVATAGVSAQEPDVRMVIGTDVRCRAAPDRAASVAASLHLGERVWISDSRIGADGERWYARREQTCWVLGSLTAPLSGYERPDSALLALADRALDPATRAGFLHLVAVDNILIERRLRRPPFVRATSTIPALLDLRHLQIVQAAAQAAGSSRDVRNQPLHLAWVLGRADLVVEFEPGDNYHVPASRFWALYDRRRDDADAEQLAWAAATTPAYGDECYSDCVLSMVADTYMRYWRAFPQGAHVAESVALAHRRAEYAARFCIMVSVGELTIGPDLSQLIGEMRSSLTAVTVAGKGDLLRLLTEIDRDCRPGAVADLGDPRAVPGLVRALGSGFSLVPERLAAFGERAAPAVLDVLAAPTPNNEQAYQALVTLTRMTRAADWSDALRARVRVVAERWLTTSQGNLLTLVSAIDLAVALADPGLDRIVESLSRDEREVVARGLTSADYAAVQRRAAAALSGRRAGNGVVDRR